MTKIEKVKRIREITMSPVNKINEALATTNEDMDAAIELLVKQKQANATDMSNRIANNSIVYSYVHNNKIGAMIVLACQTDFVSRNEMFLGLAKDICMHIVSSPTRSLYIDENDINPAQKQDMISDIFREVGNKPEAIRQKIVDGKMSKWYSDVCLVNQKFVKNEDVTIKELIQSVSSTLGEKIEIKKFIRYAAGV